MERVEQSFQNPLVHSIHDDLVFMVGWGNPNDGNGTHASKGTLFIEKTCSLQNAGFWLKLDDTDPKSWRTWGEGQPRYPTEFSYDGNGVAPKWLEVFHSIPSNASPFPVPEDSTVRAIALSVAGPATCTIELYKNITVLLDTITLTAASIVTKKELSYGLVTGDSLSAKLATGSARDITYYPHVQVNMVP